MWFREPNALLVIVFFVPLLTLLLYRARARQVKLAAKAKLEFEPQSLRLWPRIMISSILISSLAIALAQPETYSVKAIPVRSDTQVAFLMDVSVSMAGSKEPNPCQNKKSSQPCEIPQNAILRIDRAKSIIKNTMDSLGVVSIAVYGFSNLTVWQMPFTYSPQKELIDNGMTAGSLQAVCNNQENCSDPWTAIYSLISEFDCSTANKSDCPITNKIIVLLTDGDSGVKTNQDNINVLKNEKIKLFVVTVGDENEHIWLYDNDGNTTGYYPKPLPIKDVDLKFLAEGTGGKSFKESDVANLVPAIESAVGQGINIIYINSEGDTSLSPLFFFAAMVVLLIFTLIYIVGVRPPLVSISIRSLFRVKK